MNAIPMIEACARHQGGLRVMIAAEPTPVWRGTVYRPGGDPPPSDRGVAGYVPLPAEPDDCA